MSRVPQQISLQQHLGNIMGPVFGQFRRNKEGFAEIQERRRIKFLH
jgi:hypothetical protein